MATDDIAYYQRMLNEIDCHAKGLTEWEQEFIKEQLDRFRWWGSGTMISVNTRETIERIHRQRM